MQRKEDKSRARDLVLRDFCNDIEKEKSLEPPAQAGPWVAQHIPGEQMERVSQRELLGQRKISPAR